jgi:hypothetical protein
MLPRSVSPDAIRREWKRTEDRLAELERAPATATAAVVTGWTDAQPRWIALPVAHTLFTGTAATVVDAVLTELPAGTVCTHQWVEPGTLFVSAGDTWRMSIVKAAPIYSAGGSPKAVDVTTPDAIDQQHAAEYIVSDSAGANDWYVRIETGGVDTANLLTQGTATMHLLVSVPGAITDDLPHV